MHWQIYHGIALGVVQAEQQQQQVEMAQGFPSDGGYSPQQSYPQPGYAQQGEYPQQGYPQPQGYPHGFPYYAQSSHPYPEQQWHRPPPPPAPLPLQPTQQAPWVHQQPGQP